MTHPPGLAILCDFLEEGWPSMDLVADALAQGLVRHHAHRVAIRKVRPEMRMRFSRSAITSNRGRAFNLDRLAGRFIDYPATVRRIAGEFEMFHIADHSYAHLALSLPKGRTGVFCHDLDAFRCLIEPERAPRPWWFRRMARRILTGMQGAAVVFHSTTAVREEILRHRLVSEDRLVRAPYGVAPEFATAPLDASPAAPYLLHVGSSIPRKRIDVLLNVFARVRARVPDLRLIHAGADFTAAQVRQLDSLGLQDAVTSVVLTRGELASLYRGASLVLLPSEAEGFGLPVIEAMACGATIVVSDLPVLREVGGEAVTYCAVADVDQWADTVTRLLRRPELRVSTDRVVARAAQFTWSAHSQIIADAYCAIFERLKPPVREPGRHFG